MSSKDCYFPNGAFAPNYTPCDPGTKNSACCSTGQTCTTHGLCFDNGYLARGACTDKNWDNEACPKYCYTSDGPKNGSIDGPHYVLSCGTYILAKTFVCAGKGEFGTGVPNCTSDNIMQFQDPAGVDLIINSTKSIASGSSSSASKSTSTPTSTSTSAFCAPAAQFNSSSPNGVSGGTIGAAVIAALFGTAFLITLALLILQMKKRKSDRGEADRKISELDGSYVVGSGDVKHEYQPTSPPPVELAGAGRKPELYGS
ncbi:hypothetical protein EJ08DRAFT_738318 [Tothia fuscella]|uniref:Uncharacterized protein n=1 Tax=Tothia fuscella TaxID=1048955 RepID=A0A9P4NHF3_9PEZI|nr:hypothetical protein EJ08DRAFT_738318 [Tothia fuscella]